MTTLTNKQYESLIVSITNALLNSNEEFGLGEAGDLRDTARQTVNEWAEQNGIEILED